MERKGLKRFEGFKGFELFKVCTLRERISHVLSKNCHVLGNQTLFSEAERGNCFLFWRFSRLCNFQNWSFSVYFGLCTKEIFERND